MGAGCHRLGYRDARRRRLRVHAVAEGTASRTRWARSGPGTARVRAPRGRDPRPLQRLSGASRHAHKTRGPGRGDRQAATSGWNRLRLLIGATMSRRARSVTLRVPKKATEPSTIVATTPEIARAGAPGATAN